MDKNSKGLDFSLRRINPHKMLKKDLVWLHTNRCRKHGRPFSEHPNCLFEEMDKGLIKPPYEEKIGFFDIEACKEYANWGYIIAYAIKPMDKKPLLRKIKPSNMRSGAWDKDLMIQLVKDLRQFDRVVVYWGKDQRWDVPYVRTRTLYWKQQALKAGRIKEAELLQFPEYMELYVYDLYDPVKAKLKMSRKGLGYVSRYFGIPAKETWLDSDTMNNAMLGKKEAINRIGKHCTEDVETTEGLYKLLHVYTRNSKTSI
jgi:hypothetical protein